MTEMQKYKISMMRSKGLSYGEIGERLGLSMGCVKVYCFRNGLDTKTMKAARAKENGNFCAQCGRELVQKEGVN